MAILVARNQSKSKLWYSQIFSKNGNLKGTVCIWVTVRNKCHLILTLNIEMGPDFRRSVTVFSNACVFTGLFPSYSLIKEKQIVRAHFLAFEKPMIIGLGISFGSAKYFIWGRAFVHFDVSFRDFDIFRRICKDIFFCFVKTCIIRK